MTQHWHIDLGKMDQPNPNIRISEATVEDSAFVTSLMKDALAPYYGGDHVAHAERIFSTHISGGRDKLGFFSTEQKMFIARIGGVAVGLIHVVGKRQDTYKISPLIVSTAFRGQLGLGKALLRFAEDYALSRNARQIYCTVAEQNRSALQFFVNNRYTIAGRSDSHYKEGITELMLYKLFVDSDFEEKFDRPHISVLPCEQQHEPQIRELLLSNLPNSFSGIDSTWVDSLFEGYRRRESKNVNEKFKVIFVAIDRADKVFGIVGATPKKGEPIKLMPFIATTLPAFTALLTDIPFHLKEYGRKLYIHISPNVEETIALQQHGWKFDAAMPEAYHTGVVTQQWSVDIKGNHAMRSLRVKLRFLQQIIRGEKTLEVRVGYAFINTIKCGERLILMSREQSQVIKVSNIRRYPSFTEMLKIEKADRIVPGKSLDEVLALLKEIYPPDREKLGVVVLEIEPERQNNQTL